MTITWLACTVGALVCLPWAGTLARELPDTRASAIGAMAYLALVPLTLGFLTWGYALARTTAGRMGATLYLVTPIAILLGWLLLGEAPPAAALAGGGLCLIGVYISARSSSSVSASSGGLSGRYRFTRANRSATPPG